MGSVAQAHKSWNSILKATWLREDDTGTHFVQELTVPEESTASLGCPASLFMEFDFPHSERAVLINFQWFQKRATRLTEALWLSMCPRVSDSNGWMLDKMGELISPLEVIRDGNRKLHAVGSGVQYHDERGRLTIESLDAPLVAPGAMSLLDFNNRRPPLRRGMHFNLFNNVFGTNFPMWFEEDARFRFVLRFSE